MITSEELEKELKKYWKIKSLRLFGKYTSHTNGTTATFEELRNLNGDLLFFPSYLNLRVSSREPASAFMFANDKLVEGEYYQFEAQINTNEEKREQSPLFVVSQPFGKVSNEVLERLDNEKLIREIYWTNGESPGDAKKIAKSLKELQDGLYSKQERFVFELLQNADDFPVNGNQVEVELRCLNEFVLFSHNGRPFSQKDVKSICDIGESTKVRDTSTTGYKGIGFKSVFKYSSKVFITSGSFHFCFDKHHYMYNNFDQLYKRHAVMKKFEGEKDKYTGSNNVPWQLKPIWYDKYRFPDEVRQFESWFNSNVGICMEFGEKNINKLKGKLSNLFHEPRFALFLKNINKVKYHFRDDRVETLTKEKIDPVRRITYGDNKWEYFIWESESIEFHDRQEEFKKVDGIPPKLIDDPIFSISFAGKIKDGSLVKEENAVIFAFLPTQDISFKLPFLINSDFITSSNRQDILSENEWNIFLYEHAGYQLFKWLKYIAKEYPHFRNSYLNLLPSKYSMDGEIFTAFNIGYGKGIEKAAFLPTVDGLMVTVKEAVYDETGLFERVDPVLIHKLDNFEGLKLIDPEVFDEEAILKEIGVKTFTTDNLEDLLNDKNVREILAGDAEKLCDFLKGIYSLENGKEIIKKLKNVPLIKKENGDYEKVQLFKKGVPKKYSSLFTSLNILVPLPDNLENRLKNDEELNTIFVELLELGSFDIKDTINKLNDDRIKTSFTEDSSVFQSEKEKVNAAVLMWQFLFEQRNFEVNNQPQVDRRFKDVMIPDNQGNLVQLQKSKIEKDSVSKGNQSYLYQKFGDKEHNLLDLDKFKSDEQVDDEVVKSFFKEICPDIEITNYRLFKEAFESLEKEDFKPLFEQEQELEDVIQAGLDYYQFTRKENNLLQDTLVANLFPMVTRDGSIVPSKEVYLPKVYEKLAPNDDFYAEELFEGVEGIYFLSEKYLNHISEEEYTEFYNFLQKLDIKPGLKVYRSEEIKRNNRVDFVEVDDGFSLYNMRQMNVTTNDNFSLIRHLSSLSGKIENLVVFWEKLNYFWKKHRFTEDIRYKRPAPFIYLLSNHKLILTKGLPKSSKEIYDPSLSHKFPDLDDYAELDFGKFPGLKEKIHFKDRLSKTDLKKMLSRSDELSLKNYEVLLKEHLLPQNLNQDELNEIINAAKFRSLSGDYKSIDQLIYVDKNIQETPLVSLSTSKSALAQVTIHHLNMGSQGRDLFNKFGVNIVGKENILCKVDESDNQQLKKETFIDELEVFNLEEEKPITDLLKEFNFVQCDKIELSFENFDEFTEDVYYYIDDKTIYFKSIRDLVAATSEKVEITQQVQRKLEDRLKERLKDKKTDHIVDDKESDKNYILDYEKIIEGKIDLAQNIQNELHKEAIIKGTILLDRKGYEVTNETYAFEDGNNAEILNILSGVDNKRVMVRSAKAGLLFLHFKSWQSLIDEDRELLVMTGDSIDDFIHIKTREELLNLKNNSFNLIRKRNVNDARTLTDMIECDHSDKQGHLIFIANEKGYQSLVNTVFDTQEEYNDDGNISANPGVEL